MLDEIKPYLKEIIYNLKKLDTWKIQFSIATNFIYFKDTDRELVVDSKSNNIEIMIFLNLNFHFHYYQNLQRNC